MTRGVPCIGAIPATPGVFNPGLFCGGMGYRGVWFLRALPGSVKLPDKIFFFNERETTGATQRNEY